MGDIISTAKANWAVISQAPWAFAAWTAIIIAAVWAIVTHLKANTVETLESRLKLRDDEIADYKRKLSGASPDEARSRIDALELSVSLLMPRRLSADQVEAFTAAARMCAGVATINYDMAYASGSGLSQQLTKALSDADWEVRNGIVGGPSFRPAEGVNIHLSPEPERSPAERSLVCAFQAAGIAFAIDPFGPRIGWDSISITLTQPEV